MILREDFFCNLETIPRSNEVNKLILIFTVHSNCLPKKIIQEAWLTPSNNNMVQVRHAFLIGTTNGEILTTRTLPQNDMYLLENTRTVLIMGYAMVFGYITSIQTLQNILKVYVNIPYIHLEDIHIGFCVKKLCHQLVNIGGFFCEENI
jgi:hypothetical protein